MTAFTYGSLFSGIGGFDVGFDSAGAACAFQVERDKRCLGVLGKHWPKVPRFNDVTTFNAAATSVRPGIICGGFPCQDISVAGRRAGLAGERSGLWWQFHRVLGEFRPRWVLIENVGGLLSSWSPAAPLPIPAGGDVGRTIEVDENSDLAAILDALADLGYLGAYRVFDSEWFHVAQRRERIFIVGILGKVRGRSLREQRRISRLPCEVLFERESLPWDPPPSREAWAGVAGKPSSRIGGSDVAHTLRAEGFDASEDGTGRGTPLVAFSAKDDGRDAASDISPTLRSMNFDRSHANGGGQVAVCVPLDMRQASRGATMTNNRSSGSGGAPGTGIGEAGDPSPTVAGSHVPAVAGPFIFEPRIGRSDRGQPSDVVPTLKGSIAGDTSDMRPCVAGGGYGVRRLTPRECERLQGFPDDFTRWDASGNENSDAARYRMLGNAVTTTVAAWIARRIVAIDKKFKQP